MRAALLNAPGAALGSYPERSSDAPQRRNLSGSATPGIPRLAPLEQRRQARFVADVEARGVQLVPLGDEALRAHVRVLRAELGAADFNDDVIARAFALVREATRRCLGVAHYPSQMIAAHVMLSGRLAEMATGEGKTLAAGLAAATAGLAGLPVHVITSNDYLVQRDAEHLGPVYRFLGLTVGFVTQPMSQDERRAAYGCDIAYCTAKELVFDYLRDRLVRRTLGSALQERVHSVDVAKAAPSKLLLRGLWVALIDEADSILIDEARTPLILSQPRVNAQQQRYFKEALQIAIRLKPGTDFKLDTGARQAVLTEPGRAAAEQRALQLGGLWQDRRHREEVIALALAAHHIFARDRDYIVRDRKILMVDQTTGRVAPGRMWSKGLHQLLEVKEGCAPTGELETIAQITYQRYFPRYLHLCGMSGTLAEAAKEFKSVYGLSIARVPLRLPSQRVALSSRMYATREDQWHATVARVKELAAAGRPILIGTDSVADTDQLSYRLAAANVVHSVLNARDDAEEAQIVARAGHAGRVTVTTNMAGRGTDIPLGPGVAQRGGLHVICCQHNDSRRIDRQLHGRCARQGDPGSVETILCAQGLLIGRHIPAWIVKFAAGRGASSRPLPRWLGALLAWLPQKLEERRQRVQRRLLLQQDARIEGRLSFAGRGE
jgi:preprotein translocase subunit SecA